MLEQDKLWGLCLIDQMPLVQSRASLPNGKCTSTRRPPDIPQWWGPQDRSNCGNWRFKECQVDAMYIGYGVIGGIGFLLICCICTIAILRCCCCKGENNRKR